MTTRCPCETSACRKHGAHCWCPPLKRPVPPTGVITIVKETNPPKESPPFQFTGDLGDFTLRSGEERVFPDLVPGEYTVIELPLPDWGLLEIDCDDQVVVGQTSVTITVKPFRKTTCTFVNTDEGCITVIKEVAGPDRTFDFTVDGQPFSIETTNGSGFYHIMGLDDGIHNVTELIPVGWFLTDVVCDNGQTGTTGGPGIGATGGVDVDVVAGQVQTCTFSNALAGQIIVKKITDPRNSLEQFEFEGSWGEQIFMADGDIFARLVPPGTYTVTEHIPVGWDLTTVSCTGGLGSTGTTGPAGGTGGAEFTVGPGQTVECIFTNTQRGSLTVIKQIETVNGTGPAFQFSVGFGPEVSLFGGDSINFPNVRPDTYQITESVPEGWDLTTIDCGSGPTGMTASSGEIGNILVTIPPGQDVECIFTNTERVSISVNKVSLGATGTFTFDYSGPEGTGSFDITTAGSPDGTGSFVLDNLVPGEYTVNERVVNDWAITDVTCDQGVESEIGFTVTLAPGQNVACEFTNTPARTFILNAGEIGTVNVPEGFPNLEYWVVGGGGKGSGTFFRQVSGGGGRSKVENGTRLGLTPGDPIQYVVGQGGVLLAVNGQDSTITVGLDTITASGGLGTIATLDGGNDGGGGGYISGIPAGQGGAAGQAEPGENGTPTGGGKGGDGLAVTATVAIFSGLPGIGGASFVQGPPFGGGGAGGVGASNPAIGATNGSGNGRGIGGRGYGAGTGGDGGLIRGGQGGPGVVVLRFIP